MNIFYFIKYFDIISYFKSYFKSFFSTKSISKFLILFLNGVRVFEEKCVKTLLILTLCLLKIISLYIHYYNNLITLV